VLGPVTAKVLHRTGEGPTAEAQVRVWVDELWGHLLRHHHDEMRALEAQAKAALQPRAVAHPPSPAPAPATFDPLTQAQKHSEALRLKRENAEMCPACGGPCEFPSAAPEGA
jgi:hypothetical protein